MLAENYFNTGNQLKDSGQLYTAMIAYQKALSIKPDYVQAYKKLAEIYLMQRNFDAGISACQKAVKIQPNFASAYLTLGNIFQSQNLFEQAINTYSQALKIEPSFTQVYANLGSVYYKQRQFNLAISNYQRALEINPKMVSVQLMLGNVFAQIGEFDAAVSCYQKLLQIEPKYPQVYFKLAEIFTLYSNLEFAIDYYQKALSIQPNYRDAFAKLYKLLKPETTEQELEVLFAEWQKLVKEDNQNIKEYIDSVIQEKSTNLGEKKKFTAEQNRTAIIPNAEHRIKPATFNLIPEQTVDNLSYLDTVEENLEKTDKFTTFEEQQLKPEFSQKILNFPAANEEYGIKPTTFNLIPEQKIDNFENTSDNLPYPDAVEENLEKTGKVMTFEYQPLESEFPQKILKFPAAEAYINQANMALKQGNLATAIASCKQALKIQPDYSPCYVTLGNAFYQQNNLEAALHAYRQGLEIDPELAEVQGNIGSVYL